MELKKRKLRKKSRKSSNQRPVLKKNKSRKIKQGKSKVKKSKRHLRKRNKASFKTKLNLKQSQKKYQRLLISLSLFSLFIIAGVVFLIFNLGTAIVVDQSMMPTLSKGTRLVYKKTKRFKIGDVVLLTSPDQTNYEQIRRVVGLPGQKVDYLSDNSIVIDGVVLEEPYLNQKIKQTEEKKLNSIAMAQFLEATPSLTESFVSAGKIPKEMLLVLGDNRLEAYDSRYYGLVPIKDVKGKADRTYWPLRKIKTK